MLAEDGGELPVPRPLAEHQADTALHGWIWGMVDVPVERYFGPAEKISITVPAPLLARIDDDARRHGESRSGGGGGGGHPSYADIQKLQLLNVVLTDMCTNAHTEV